jgi:hypothetical protein
MQAKMIASLKGNWTYASLQVELFITCQEYLMFLL